MCQFIMSVQELVDGFLTVIFSYYGNPEELISEVKLQYPDLENEDVEIRTKALTQMCTDFGFAATSDFAAEHHSMFVVRTLLSFVITISNTIYY